jgi:uroporphyrinogen decarboxylase
MKPRDRVLRALAHESTDRPPFESSFVPEFAARLRADLGLPDDVRHDPHCGRWNGYDVEILTGQDMLTGCVGWVDNYYLEETPYTDEWGIEWRIKNYETPFGPGHYTEMARHPLADATLENGGLTAYQPPDPHRPELYDNLHRLMAEYHDDYYICGRLHCTIFETAWALRGFQRTLLDLAMEPELTDALMEIPFRYHAAVATHMAEVGVDMIWLGDDFGGQKNMLIAPSTWRTFFKERMARLIADARAIKPDITFAFHSDGAYWQIVPDLIEIGIDALNPIQPDSMDPARLKREFGDNLTFFGAIDVQKTLPFGTPESVAAEYRERAETLGVGGGWICAPTHHVQQDTPLENWWALVEAATGQPAARRR